MPDEVFERITQFDPAYDKRPKYGIHGVTLRMVLKGSKGATQFVLYTNWELPKVQAELDAKIISSPDMVGIRCTYHPLPADLGYHSPVPRYEGQSEMDCEYTSTGKCFYDGSGLNAERIYNVLVRNGSEAVWKELEKFYHELFESKETQNVEV